MQTQLMPPFNRETALQKVRAAEDAWNLRDPQRVSMAYSPETRWRNRDRFLHGRAEVQEFLRRKWLQETEYRLIKELWAFTNERIAVRFQYEWKSEAGFWFRSYGNENWEFDRIGLMSWRQASINNLQIAERERMFRWDTPGTRPLDHPGLTELGL